MHLQRRLGELAPAAPSRQRASRRRRRWRDHRRLERRLRSPSALEGRHSAAAITAIDGIRPRNSAISAQISNEASLSKSLPRREVRQPPYCRCNSRETLFAARFEDNGKSWGRHLDLWLTRMAAHWANGCGTGLLAPIHPETLSLPCAGHPLRHSRLAIVAPI